jgi:coiled-coil domain-containing protein 55
MAQQQQPHKFGLVKKMGFNTVQRKVLNSGIFNVDDDGDNTNNDSFGKFPYTPKIIDNSIDITTNSSLVEDPSVFDYDGSYDTFKNKSTKATSLSTSNTSQPKQAQYINDLLKSAKVRELERERIFEKKIIKEQQMEGQQDETKFITSAYQKKLLESKKWEYEDNIADEIDKKTDVRGKGMEGFYKNLLTKNIALGSDIATSALSAYTSGSNRQQKLIEENQLDHINDDNYSNNNNSKFDNNVVENNVTKENSNKRLLDTTSNDIQQKKKSIIEENVNENDNESKEIINTTTINTNHDTKEIIILSAKERYLARKNK